LRVFPGISAGALLFANSAPFMTSSLFLLREMVARDFKSRYAGSAGGFLWSMLQPLWTLALFTWVFSVIIRFDLSGELTQNFAVYLFGGLLPWMAFNEGVHRAATCVVDNGGLVTKLRFPAELLVASVVLGALVQSAIAGGIYAIVLGLTGELSLRGFHLLLIAVPLQVAFTAGLGLFAAAIHVYFRDAFQLLSMLLNAWFYFTPIVFPLAVMPERMRAWLELNPLTPLVGLYRAAFLGGTLGPPGKLVPLVVAAVVSLGVGLTLFRRLKGDFADEL
jgi:lipopolysaccharide transport system permease protein